jgi:hypothetical protein
MANRVAIAPTMSSDRRPKGSRLRRRFMFTLPRGSGCNQCNEFRQDVHERSRDRAASPDRFDGLGERLSDLRSVGELAVVEGLRRGNVCSEGQAGRVA